MQKFHLGFSHCYNFRIHWSLSIILLSLLSRFLFFFFSTCFHVCNLLCTYFFAVPSTYLGIIAHVISLPIPPTHPGHKCCVPFNSGCEIGYPLPQVLDFLDFFGVRGSGVSVLSPFRFFPFAFFPSRSTSVVVDDFTGVSKWISSTVFLGFFFALDETVG